MVVELISTCLGIFADPIKQYIVTPLNAHINYAFTLHSYVDTLRNKVKELEDKRDRLRHSVDEARGEGDEIYPNVTVWLSTADEAIGEANELLQGEEEAKKKCCSGFCPNLKTRLHLSKKADIKASAIDKQLQSEKGLYPISFRTLPPPITDHSSGEALPSRVLILDHIMDALKDPNLNMIGVYGMGGIGKTTLAKEVLRQAVQQKLFDHVVIVAVSETPDLSRIQQDIADALGLQFQAEGVPIRARELHQRLKEAKALIILDDVWEKLDLSSDIGIPSGEASKCCKIFLTSRKRNVLCIDMPTKKEFPLGLIKQEEAWELFEKILNKGDDPAEFLAHNRNLAKEIANKCGGLPLLIEKVATDLRNNKELSTWDDMLSQLKRMEGTEIYKTVGKVFESSYEKVPNEEAKSIFLLCPLFRSSNIRIQDLLIYSMGLGIFEWDSIEESRNRVSALIAKLKNESLLLEGDKAGFVKIHDVVRDIAATIALKKHCAFVGKGKIESADLERKDCRRICLPYCEIPALPEVLQCPEVEMFSLFVQDRSTVIHNSFFERAKKLKVLHLIGVSFVSSLPSSLGLLTCLQTLSLDGCWPLKNVAIVAELKQLEVLSFAGSDVAELPREIEALTKLKRIDLTGCRFLEVIPSNVLSNLCLLEELYVLYSYDGWDTKGNASLEELKKLSCLTTLEIRVKDDKLLPEDWFFNGVQNYKIIIGHSGLSLENLVSYIKDASRLLMLTLKLKKSIGLMDRIKEFMEGAEVLYLSEVNAIENLLYDSRMEKIISFQRLRVLHIDEKCDSLGMKSYFLPFSSEKSLPHLQEMEVRSCSNIETVVGKGNEDEVMELTQLTTLKLIELPNLIGICRTTRGMVSFPNLTSLEVSGCDSLKYVFTTSMVKSLQQLRKLDIHICDSMEEIMLVTECEEVVVFPQLKELQIIYCSSLKKFVWKDSDRNNNNNKKESRDECLFNELVTLPNLEIMKIEQVGNLRYLWHQQFADNDSFSKLKSLEIRDCEKLSAVFPSNAYRRFERLESLHVSSCNAVKEIYEYEGVGCYEETNVLQPFALQRVMIYSLPLLKHIWSKNIDDAFSFQSLQSVIVKSCPELKYVIPASIACGLQQLQELEIENCGVEMIIADPKNEGSEGARIRTFEWPKLGSLKVCNCDELIKFGSIISKAKHDIPTQGSLCFIQKIIPNVKVLHLNHHCLKAIQSDDHRFPEDQFLWKLEQVTLFDLKEESVRFLLDFLRQIYSLDELRFIGGFLGEIFSLDDEGAIGDQEQQYHLRLKRLDLFSVSKIKHIVMEDHKTLMVAHCYDLISIAPPSSSASFINLTTLHVSMCPRMTSLVTASTAKSMIHLTELKVENCEMMEDIIVANDDEDCTNEHDDVITFNKLKHLSLYGLHSLNSFCSGNYIFNFPLLEQVFISYSSIKIFCGGTVHTPKLQCEGNLNDIIAQQKGWIFVEVGIRRSW